MRGLTPEQFTSDKTPVWLLQRKGHAWKSLWGSIRQFSVRSTADTWVIYSESGRVGGRLWQYVGRHIALLTKSVWEHLNHIKQLLQCWQEMSGSKRGWNRKREVCLSRIFMKFLRWTSVPHPLIQPLFHRHPLQEKNRITSGALKWTLVTPKCMEAIIKPPQLRKKQQSVLLVKAIFFHYSFLFSFIPLVILIYFHIYVGVLFFLLNHWAENPQLMKVGKDPLQWKWSFWNFDMF